LRKRFVQTKPKSLYCVGGVLPLVGERAMCEFTVFLKGEAVFRDAIYVKVKENHVLLRNVLGEIKTIKKCVVSEIDVTSERLILKPLEE
jgi:predicted RNA-binding protein